MGHHIHKPKSTYRDTVPVPEDTPKVQGYNQGVDHRALLQSFLNTGFRLPTLAWLYSRSTAWIGNLLIPEENYAKLDKWMKPILEQMLLEQNTQGVRWTPFKVIHRLGKEIDNPESVYFWAYKNNIPVFSPALTDGTIGDILYLFSAENPGLILDITEDVSRLNNMAVAASRTGIIILGGGVAKHHTCNANVWRGGADYALYVNMAQEFDGCDSGARPDEAVSWGKITAEAKPVKVFADATIIFPLLVAETFAVHGDEKKKWQEKGMS